MQHKPQIEELIESEELVEAMELLKLTFKSNVSQENFTLLYRIVVHALEKNDVAFAANAATYGEGWFGHIKVPKKASWNVIIHKALQQGGLPKLDIPIEFLTPRSYCYAPWALNMLAIKVWEYFKEHHWSIPGYEVVFRAYGQSPGSEKAVLAYCVAEIKGKDFILGFNGIQGRLTENVNLNNTGGFSFIAASNFIMTFFQDDSGPAVFEYSGNKWPEVVSKMHSYSSFYHDPDWKEVDCSIPLHNQVFFNFLSGPIGFKEAIQSQRKSEQTKKQFFVEKAINALQNDIMPNMVENTQKFDASIDRKAFC